MKKYITVFMMFVTITAICGCGNNTTKQKLMGTYVYTASGSGTSAGPITNAQNVELTSEAFAVIYAALTGSTSLSGAAVPGASVNSSVQKAADATINATLSGPAGGSVVVTGSSSANPGLTIFSYTATETMNNFAWTKNGIVYKINGSLSIRGYFDTSARGTQTLDSMSLETSNITFWSGNDSFPLALDLDIWAYANGHGQISGSINTTRLYFTY